VDLHLTSPSVRKDHDEPHWGVKKKKKKKKPKKRLKKKEKKKKTLKKKTNLFP